MSDPDYKYDRCAELGVKPKPVSAVVAIPLAAQLETLRVRVIELEREVAYLKSLV